MKPNPKIQRLVNELARLDAKIAEMQAKRREVEQQKTELENTDIVAAVRSLSVTPEELPALLAALRSGGAALLAAPEQAGTSGQHGPKPEPSPRPEPGQTTKPMEDADDEE